MAARDSSALVAEGPHPRATGPSCLSGNTHLLSALTWEVRGRARRWRVRHLPTRPIRLSSHPPGGQARRGAPATMSAREAALPGPLAPTPAQHTPPCPRNPGPTDARTCREGALRRPTRGPRKQAQLLGRGLPGLWCLLHRLEEVQAPAGRVPWACSPLAMGGRGTAGGRLWNRASTPCVMEGCWGRGRGNARGSPWGPVWAGGGGTAPSPRWGSAGSGHGCEPCGFPWHLYEYLYVAWHLSGDDAAARRPLPHRPRRGAGQGCEGGRPLWVWGRPLLSR